MGEMSENSPVDGLKEAVAAREVGLMVAYRLHVPAANINSVMKLTTK